MPTADPNIILCSCEDTMALEPARVGAGCKGRISTARHLCGPELDRFRDLARNGRLTVACTHQQPLFEEIAEDEGLGASLSFVNVRETAGWSSEGRNAAPKMAALIAAAAEYVPPPTGITLESEGVTLIYGRGQAAIDAALRLKDRLDVTVLLSEAGDAVPPARSEFPIRLGRIRSAKGHLGQFEIVIDGFAAPNPSSRTQLAFGPKRDGAVSKADILVDLSGGVPLFPGHDLRPGYLTANPASPIAIEQTLQRAAELVGTFDKPRYVAFDASLCVHSRSRIVGCRRCLDLCPAGAITPAGNHVAIDAAICGGCGQCAAACPTGAASYDLPRADVLMRQLRAMLTAYRAAGGGDAVVLLHDRTHGAGLIDAAARFSNGLPANVIPLGVNEVSQIGLEAIASAFAYGAAGLRILTRAKPRHDIAGLHRTIATAEPILVGLGFGEGLVGTIETDDPDTMLTRLAEAPRGRTAAKPAGFRPDGGKRDVMRLALRELHRAAPSPTDRIALPAGAVFGRVNVRTDGCTLCLACVSACPTQALGDAEAKPQLRFDESLCVQCGLCQGTCPEKVISLEPRIDFAAFEAGAVVLKEEEPFCCTRCGKAFGVRSTIERVAARLEGRHWMFAGENSSRAALIRMCEDCRITVSTETSFDPYAGAVRPAAKTSDDYLREREVKAREQAMRSKIDKGEA